MWLFFTRQSSSRYLVVIALLALPVACIFLLNYFILYQAGELQTVQKIAQKIQDGEHLYASGIHDLRRELNLEIIKIRKPEIVAFGSSRPLNFRQEYFKDDKTYACACMAVPNLSQGKIYAQKMLEIHKPDVVILSVDFWWFTQVSGVKPPALFVNKPPMTLQKILKPMQLVTDGTITPTQYGQLLKSDNDFSKVSTYKKEGLLGITRGMGVRQDGSFLSGVRFSDYADDYYKKWRSILHNPNEYIEENDRYGPDKKIIDAYIDDYADLVAMFHEHNIKVIGVMLPLAPTIYDALASSSHHKHVFDVSKKIAGYSDEFYDFHNPHLLTSDMCEYEDAHHAGDVVFMRVLQKIMKKNSRSILGDYVDKNALKKHIKRHAGRTVAIFNPSAYLTKERDFTGFGCSK